MSGIDPSILTRARDAAIDQARNAPQLIADLKTADPKLAAAITGRAQITTHAPIGTLAVTAISWLSARYGLGWDQDTCNLIAGCAIIAGGYLMGFLSRVHIAGLLKPSEPPQKDPPP